MEILRDKEKRTFRTRTFKSRNKCRTLDLNAIPEGEGGVLRHFWPHWKIVAYIYFIYNLHASTANHPTHSQHHFIHRCSDIDFVFFLFQNEMRKKNREFLLLFHFDACIWAGGVSAIFLSLDFQ